MTEDEAKQKWCPFASSRVNVRPLGNAGESYVALMGSERDETGKLLQGVLCLGKDCMAWRNGKIEENPLGLHPHTWHDLKPYHNEDSPRRFIRHGYCGLAGQPDDLP